MELETTPTVEPPEKEVPLTTEPPEPQQGAEEPAAPEQADTPEEHEEEKRKRDVQSRINELTAKRRAAERETERLRAELEAARAQQPPKPPSADKPTPDKYETWEQYLDARDDWNRTQWEQTLSKREQERAAQEALKSEEQKWGERKRGYETAEASYRAALGQRAAEYDAATEAMTPFLVDARGYFTNADLARALYEAGPEVVHHLGKHLDVLERLVTSDPVTIGREIGKIEKAVKDGGREGRRFTQATKPPPSVAGGGSPTTDPMKMSDAEYRAWRNGTR